LRSFFFAQVFPKKKLSRHFSQSEGVQASKQRHTYKHKYNQSTKMPSVSFVYDEYEMTLTRYSDEQEDGEFRCINWDIDLPEGCGAEEPPIYFADENDVVCYSLTTSTDPITYKNIIASFNIHIGPGSITPVATSLVKYNSMCEESPPMVNTCVCCDGGFHQCDCGSMADGKEVCHCEVCATCGKGAWGTIGECECDEETE